MTLFALKLWVSIKSLGAEAVCPVLFCLALCVDATCTTDATRVLTLALVTSLVYGTVLVASATVVATVSFTYLPESTVMVRAAFNFGNTAVIFTSPF